jgi:hypothetical protein
MSGEVVQRTRGEDDPRSASANSSTLSSFRGGALLLEATSKSGISGRLIQACQGQCVGLAVRSAWKASGPRKMRTAKAP